MLPHMVKGLLKGGFHLVSRGPRNNVRSHGVQMLLELVDLALVPVFKHVRDHLFQVTIGRHARGARLGFELGGILVR